MKKNIIRLIQDDIKISRLIDNLERLNVSANHYRLANSKVIFSLMGIPEDEQKTEIYFKMIEQAEDLVKYDTNEKIEELAEDIFKRLILF